MFKKKYIHIVRDEKFIDSAWRDFEEVASGQNIFLIIGLKSKLTYVKSSKILFLRPRIVWILAPFSFIFSKAVIFHSIESIFEENLILRINKKTNIAWISWGYDVYPKIKNVEEYLFDKTKEYYKSQPKSINKNYEYLKGEFKRSFKIKPSISILISRINFISPVLESEFYLLADKFGVDSNKYIRWNYLTLENDIISQNNKIKISGNSILLGNSGAIWLNHLDAIKELEQLELCFDKIIIPCSYGDNNYILYLANSLKDKLNKIQLIDSFLPYEEYVKILKNCKYLLINTERQIALGNILFFLYYGGSIVIRKNNPIVIWLEELQIPFTTMGSSDFVLVKGGDLETKSTLLSFWGKETKRSLTIDYLIKIGS